MCNSVLLERNFGARDASSIVMQLVSNMPKIKEYFRQGDIIEFVCAILE